MILRCNYRPLVKVSRFWFYNGWIRSIFSIFRHGFAPPTYLLPVSQHSSFLLWLNGIPFWGLKPTDFSEVALFFSLKLFFPTSSFATCFHLLLHSQKPVLRVFFLPAPLWKQCDHYAITYQTSQDFLLEELFEEQMLPWQQTTSSQTSIHSIALCRDGERTARSSQRGLKGKRWVCCQCFAILESVGRLCQPMVKRGIGVS